MTPKNQVRLLRLAVLTVSGLVALIILEIAVRVLLPYYNPRSKDQVVFHFGENGVPLGPENQTIRQRSPQGDYDLKVTFNRFGLRDRQDMTTATPSDWFVVGDSFGMGWGVEETNRFSDVLARTAHVRVFNICIPTDIAGYGQLVEYAERHGATISNLVISVCMENDLRDYYRDKPTAAPSTWKRSRKEALREFAKTHSALYLFLSTELQQSAALRRFFQAIGIARRRDSRDLMHYNEFDEPAILYSVDLLSKLTASHPSALVLIIPSRALWIGNARDVEAKVHDLFVGELKKRNIEFLDMRPVFESKGDPMRYHFSTDGHWNKDGHQLAGELLAQRILSGRQSTAGISTNNPAASVNPTP
jgi:hypothetical protein